MAERIAFQIECTRIRALVRRLREAPADIVIPDDRLGNTRLQFKTIS